MSVIYERRSIRKFSNQPVSEEMITQILKAGMAAPSAGNEQPWHFIVIHDRSLLEKIPEFHPYSQMLNQVNTAIMVCGDLTLEKFQGFWVQDCSAAMENMLLMAVELGLGAVWLGIYPLEDRVLATKKLLKIPEHIVPLAIMPVGYPAELKEPILVLMNQEFIKINGEFNSRESLFYRRNHESKKSFKPDLCS